MGTTERDCISTSMSACTPRMAIWAALLSVLFAASFSLVALAANFTTLIPAIWVNPLSFAPSLLLAWSYLVLMACVLDAAPPEHRVWALLGMCFSVLYATINSIVYVVQLVVVTPLVFQGYGKSAGMLAFGPRSFIGASACDLSEPRLSSRALRA